MSLKIAMRRPHNTYHCHCLILNGASLKKQQQQRDAEISKFAKSNLEIKIEIGKSPGQAQVVVGNLLVCLKTNRPQPTAKTNIRTSKKFDEENEASTCVTCHFLGPRLFVSLRFSLAAFGIMSHTPSHPFHPPIIMLERQRVMRGRGYVRGTHARTHALCPTNITGAPANVAGILPHYCCR